VENLNNEQLRTWSFLWKTHNGASPAMWDHTVLPAAWRIWTCPPQLQPDRLVLALSRPTSEGWQALVLIIYRDGLPVRRQSPVQVVTTW